MTGPVVVTGAAGFAGGHLINLLAADGVDAIGWYRPVVDTPPNVPGVRWSAVELLDGAAVRREIAHVRPSAIYHLAGAAHVGQSWDKTAQTLRVNVMGTHHVVEGLRTAAPDARLLIISSALVYGSSERPIAEDAPIAPESPYGLSKVAQELAGTAGGHRHTWIARPFNHIGPGQDPAFVSAAFAKQIAEIEAGLTAPELRVGNLEPRRDLTDVRDTVRAYRAIVEGGVPGRPYNICSGHAPSVRELLEMLLAKARVSVRVVSDPARHRPNDTPVVLGDPGRIRGELNWTPRIPLDQTADDLLQYWRTLTARTR